MKKDNVVQIKSYAFAVRIVKVYQFLCEQKKEFVLSKQLLKDTNYLTEEQADNLLKDADELLRIIGSIQKTIRNS